MITQSVQILGGVFFVDIMVGNDPGVKVSLFMHDWRQLVMFQEQK